LAVLAPIFVYRHSRLGILTEQPDELVDLTDGLGSLLTDAALTTGFVNVCTLTSGTGIAVAPAPTSSPAGGVAATSGACVSIANGRMQLSGTERVFLVEREGPAAREIAVVIVGEGWR
jgi:thiamine phosphate synthase YjbQ (UPF0047 family)